MSNPRFSIAVSLLISFLVIPWRANCQKKSEQIKRIEFRYWFLDKVGREGAHYVSIEYQSRFPLTSAQQDSIQYHTRKFVRNAGYDFDLLSLIMRRDSIQNELTGHWKSLNSLNHYKVNSIKIDTAYLPASIYNLALHQNPALIHKFDSLQIKKLK